MMTNLLNGAHVANKLFSTIARLRLLLVMFVTLTVSVSAWAETYSWTCSGTTVFSTSGSSLNGVTWKATTNGSSQGTGVSGEKCVQIAKNTGLTLETTDFNNKNIASISIQTWGSQGNTFYLKDGNTQLKSTTIPTSYTSNGAKISFSNVGVIGTKLVFNWASAGRAFNVRSITITYEDAATCTTNPTVSAGSNSSVTTTTATVSCSGGITSLGSAGCSITSYGFVYGTSSNPTISNTKVQVGTTYTTTGTAFSKELTGLTANTTYYVRPYATNGNGTAYGTQTSFKTLELPKYTVTLVPGSGSVSSTTLTELSAGAGVTLPTPTLSSACQSEGWSFAGWKTTSAVTTETTTKPTLIAAGTYKPTSNITLYAVYKRTEGGGGGGESFILSLYYDNTTYYVGTKGSGSYLTATTEESDAVTFQYEDNKYLSYDDDGDKIYISSTSDNTTLTIGTTSPSVTWTETSADGKFTYQTSATGNRYLGFNNSASPKRFAPYASSYPHSFTKHLTSSTTYYHSTPECTAETSQLATPTGLNVTNTTSTSATLSWDEVANASSYTVSVYGENDEVIAEYPGLTENTKTVSELDPETNYVFGVVAVGDGITYTNSIQAVSDVFTTSSATCTVTYNANGGIGTPPSDATEYTNGATVTVLGNYGMLTKNGYAFTGWNTKDDGTGTSYEAGETFIIYDNTPLYAQWCEAYWKLVTDESELENDTRIVIAAKDETVALSTTQNETNRGQAEITKTYNTITFGNDVQILNLLDATEDKYWLRDIDGPKTGYLYAAGTNSNNYLKTGVDNSASGNDKWSITITEGLAYISANGTNENNQLKYNTSSNLFSCYGVGNKQKDVVIYKEVCVQDHYSVTSNLTNSTANTNPTTVASNATSLTLNYAANTGYLLPETITVKMGGALLVATTDYTWDKATGTLTINVTGFYGDIDVKIVAEVDPCYQFEMSEVTATSTTPNSVTLTWTEVTGATGYNVRLGDGAFTAATGLTHTFEGLTPKTTYNWEVQAVKGTCQASQTGSITTQKESFTVSWVVNGNTTTTESVVDGNSITQYPSAPSAPSGCHEKVFVGWTNTPINTPTNAAPATLYKQKSDVPAITANTTLHAVWADVIGGGETTKSLLNDEIISFHEQGTTTSYSDLTVPSADGDWSGLFCTANSNSVYTINLKKELVNGNRPYLKSSEYNNITKVSVIATHTSTKGNRTLYLCDAATNSPESNNIGTISIAKDNNSSQLCTLSSSATTLYLYVDNGIQIKTITLTTGGTTHSAYTTLCDECTPSTLTFNDRGNTTNQEYYAGAEVPQPEDPTGVCTIPVNYVFDGWAEAEVTDGSTSYTKVNFPYSMPAKNTTLYAVYRYTEKNANSDKFMSVDKELGELVSGMDYVLTGYNDDDNYEYAMSITAYETGKYNTKFVDVQESSILYEEDIPYYEFTTTDNEIIWTIEGDEANGYTFQNKSNNKYLAVSDDKLTLSDNAAKFTIEHETGVENDEEVYYMSLLIQPIGSTKYLSSYYKNATAGVLFNLHTASTLSLHLYKRVASNLYTTSPDCGGIAITYDLNGGDGGHCTDTRVEGGSDYTICEDVPTKTGYTFLHWSDGANTYNPSDVIEDVTADITLTAQWQINTYTVIWSNNGATTPVTYEHGDDLTLPSAPESCDGVKEFVGWTEDNTFTYHATTPPSDLFTEKTATVTADATYYAVFATKGAGGTEFVLGESGTFKMYANVNGTNYYAQGGVSSSKITSTTEAANASDYTLTYADGVYTIKQGTSNVGNSTNNADLNTNETTWTISEGTNGSWRVTSNASTSRALSYRTSTSAFKAYSISNITGSPTTYYGIEFGGTSSGYSDYTTICQQIESIEVQDPQTEFYITDNFTIGSGKVIATLSEEGTTDVTALATFSGYNMNVVGTYTVTVTYMGATATYEINVKPLDNAWVLTWNVSGKTNTGLSPRSVTKGNAIGTLPVPEVPAACEGKTFMGWTESNIVPSDGVGIVYITPETVPTDNTTYYAVFATVNNFSKQMPIEDIESGSKVVVVAVASLTADGGSGKAISSRATDDTHNLQGDSVAIYDETINTPHSTCIWTIAKEDGKCVFTQDGKYLNGVLDGPYSKLKYLDTKDSWTLTPAQSGMTMTYNMESTNASDEYIEWYRGKFAIHNEVNENGDFDMQFYVTLGDGADITDYTTGCEEYTITYYGFRGGYSTSTSSDGIIVLPVNSSHTVPDCGDVVTDHTNLGREFLDVWMTQPHGGHTFKPGDTFILTQDTTLYAQWKLETTSDVTTLPTDIEDMAGTDVYVYGGTALNIQPGSTTINSLTLKGGIQSDGSYKMPTVWVPEGATLIRNSNKIYLDLAINAKNYYPFAVPFATKNDQYIDYLDPVLNEASTYGTHFVIKTYDGARRADVGEDRANNWVKVNRHQSADPSYLQPGVGYIITAMTYPDKNTATIRIPMTVPNTWFENGEQTVVGTTTRNTVSVVGHTGDAAEEHQRHAGWNFVASPYLSNFSGNNIGGEQGYINGWIDVTNGSFPYYDTKVPYVTVPVADFAYYKQTKVAEATLSPEWSFFVQIAANAGGTMNFAIEGRKQAPASVAARYAEERPVKMDVDITLTNGSESDQTGLIICDHYTHEYEIGRDLEKMFGSAYNLVVYSIMQDKTPLAYQALPIQHDMQVIPIGYRAPAKGEYTFSLNATSSIELLSEKYEQLILEDYDTGARTNLLEANYTFDSERTQSDTRFVIYPVLRKNTPTDVPNILDNSQTTHKLFHNGHLYIIHEGRVYNGNGQIVK